jgi:Bacterial Ig-like domain (group 3)
MRLSVAQGHTEGGWDESGLGSFGAVWRRMALLLSLVLVLGSVGVILGSAKPAGADTTLFQSGQVFASVGNSLVNVYSQSSGNPLIASLNDELNETYTAGSAFDSSGNFYVTDDYTGDVSEYSPSGALDGVFASGLQNPLSLAFDNQGNLYVGQQTTPYIAEYSGTGQFVKNIGPLATELSGDDWIALAPDECTFYYTTEETDILRYNMCTGQQLPNFNVQPFPSSDPTTGYPVSAYELQILPDGDVLVADSNADILLDPNGNVLQTYTCASLPGCQSQLFAISLDPDGTSFWTGDSNSGNVWEVDIATGAVQQQIDTHSGALYGLSVDDEVEVAAPAPVTTATSSTLTIQPVTGNFSSPTPVSAVLTNPSTGQPIANEPVTFTLNGSEICTGTTDSTGTATCTITPGEPSSSYTLTASFGGDTTTSTPIGSNSSSSTFTVNPDTSSVTYTGATSAVNGQPVTLSGTLTTNTPTTGTPLPTKVVTFTIGSGSTAQSCSATTDVNGNVSCTIAAVDQPSGTETVTTSFAGDSYDTSASTTSSLSVTEPTTLTVNAGSGSFNGSTTVSGTLNDSNTGLPIAGEPVTFVLNNSSTETCTGTTNAQGVASCSITPEEGQGTYTLTGSFRGDTTQPVPLTSSTSAASFVETPATTTLTYTGATSTFNGQTVTLSGTLTSGGSPVVGQSVTLTLGSGSSMPAQGCVAVTGATGAASCTVSGVNQPVGPNPVVVTYAGNNDYGSSTAQGAVQVGPSTTSTVLTVNPTSGTYGEPVTVSATLTDTYTGTGAPGEKVTLTLNGTQSCTGTTNASGVASCSITPNEAGGTFNLTASFSGDTSQLPVLLATTGSNTFTEQKDNTVVTYTGSTSVQSGQEPTLSATLTGNGAPLSGQTVTFTVGTGSTAQKCSGTTNASGAVSCSICMFNQNASPLPITVSYAGSSYYTSATTSKSVTVTTPTHLAVSAATGAYGQTTTVSGTLTNSVTGTGISGQTITLTLNGTQSCSATTGSNGKASCSIAPNESAGTYTLAGTFAGNTSVSPVLASSGGSNNFVVTKVPTSITYTGATVVKTGQTLTVSGTLTSNGSPLPAGQTLVFTLGTGKTVQTCSATTDSTGAASCPIAVNQVQGSVALTVAYAGNTTYAASSVSYSESIQSAGGGGGGGSGGGGSQSSGGNGGQGGGSEPPTGGKGGGGCPGM